MDIKTLLTDIEAAIVEKWGSQSVCESKPDILKLHEAVTVLRKQIKALKEKKQRISRQFRDESLGEQDKAALKQSMQKLSAELKQSQASLKRQEKALLDYFIEERPEHSSLPPRFVTQHQSTCADVIKIVPASSTHKEQWNNYVQSHTNASAYHLYEWRNVIKGCFGHSGKYLMAFDSSDCCRGILPLIALESRLFGHFAVSVPYFNYGGPLADNDDIAQQLLDAGSNFCQSSGLEHLEVRATQRLNSWTQRDEKASMILRLPDSEALLDQQLGSKLRAQINQAGAANLQWQVGGIELLKDFYSVFAQNMRDLGTPVYHINFFQEILLEFPEQCSLLVVYSDRKPASCAFLIGFKDMLEIPWASTLRKFNKLNANMLLYRQVLGFAINQGYQYFDFGRSSKDSGTFKFKKQWGATPLQHYWHYWLPGGQDLPQLNPNSPKYQAAIKIWKRLPVWLTRLIGPKLVKNLP